MTGKIETLDQLFEALEERLWNTECVFKPVNEWCEEDGDALFFRLDAGESPTVTSPTSSNWIEDYFTHWMALPKEFTAEHKYRLACIKSGIRTTVGAKS